MSRTIRRKNVPWSKKKSFFADINMIKEVDGKLFEWSIYLCEWFPVWLAKGANTPEAYVAKHNSRYHSDYYPHFGVPRSVRKEIGRRLRHETKVMLNKAMKDEEAQEEVYVPNLKLPYWD